jgi:AraC-like DNA-binding protein/quercetin dioxygenase-like cupin family protein
MTTTDRVNIHTPPEHAGLQLMQASFRTRSFARHSHEGYGIGVIEQGALGFYYRGDNVVAPAGRINTVNPGEVHTGHPASEQGWTYRMFYCSPAFVQQMAADIADKPAPLPLFTSGVIEDDQLAHQVQLTHAHLMDSSTPRLEQESLLLTLFSGLLTRHTYASLPMARAGNEPNRIGRVIDYLEAHFAEDIDVGTLAAVACLSPFHFIRVFSRQIGMTPHAWLMQLRVRKAVTLLNRGVSIAEAALQTGCSDQSHLNRLFKRYLGYTPGQLRNSVQDT